MKSIRYAAPLLVMTGMLACAPYEDPVWRANPPGSGPGSVPGGSLPGQVQPQAPKRIFIENRKVRLAIDLNYGGAITYLSEVNGPNMVNNYDHGRQLQTSLYSGPIPFNVNGKGPANGNLVPLGWNPVQTGDFYNNPARVVDYRQDSTRLYVKTVPLIWPLHNQPAECVMEHWIELQDNVVRVRARTTIDRPDTTQYYARPQEMPVAYLNGPYYRTVTYRGLRPFTNDAVAEPTYDDTVEPIYVTENWVALLNQQGRGLGLWQKDQHRFVLGFLGGKPGPTGEFDSPTGYMASAGFAILDHKSVFDYEYALVVGTLTDIRQFVYQQPRPRSVPDYRFGSDRQGWYYDRTTDQGVPIRDGLRVRFDGNRYLRLASPFVFWRASDVPKLYVQAAFRTNDATARLNWRYPSDPDFLPLPDRYVDFPIINDGQHRTYEIDLSGRPGWQGIINQISLVPTAPDTTRTGQYVHLRSVGSRP